VLFKAQLIRKRRQGREQVISGNDAAVRETAALLQAYEGLWIQRYQGLQDLLNEED